MPSPCFLHDREGVYRRKIDMIVKSVVENKEKYEVELIVEVSAEDKALWVEACQKTIQSNTKSQAELYQQILDMQ